MISPQEDSKIIRELISHSGLITGDSTSDNVSSFDTLILITLSDPEGITDILNTFMRLHHEVVVRNKHFNWND